MAQSRDESPSRIELVVLACLSQSKPPAEVEIGEALHELALPNESVEGARRRAGEILAVFAHRAWITSEGETSRHRRDAGGPATRRLTDDGKRVLRTAFNLSRVPTWAQVRDRHFPALALGVTPGSEIAKKACTERGITAAVLGARFGIRDVLTPMEVCDAVIADALGMPRGKLTMDRLRAHVLKRGISGPTDDAPSAEMRGYAARLAAWIAAKAVDANGTKPRMARALAKRWVSSEANPLGAPESQTTGNSANRDLEALPPNVLALTSGNGARETAAIAGSGHASGGKPPQSGGGAGPRPGEGPRPQSAGSQQVQTAGAQAGNKVDPGQSTSHGKPNEVKGNEVTTVRHTTLQPPPPPQAQPSSLLEAVRDAIPRIGADGRFGEKVYVSAIWRTIERDRKSGGITLDNFKRWLVSANRDGKLVLARADLIAAMDAKQVTESEINDRGATFHFVLDQRNGTSVSQRGSHAR